MSAIDSSRTTCSYAVSVDLDEVGVRAVRAAAYRFGERFSCEIQKGEQGPGSVRLLFAPSTTPEDCERGVRDFLREVNDQVLRELVREETKEIRAVILAHTFARIAPRDP